jgi:peptide/nickel transport system ATP-binding protein
VTIARALGVRPALLVADEPTSMLDVSIRIGVMNLLRDLVRNEHLAMLYITHDLAGARYLAHRTLVLYAGEVAEEGPTGPLIDGAKHPYTRLLLSAVPVPRGQDRPAPIEAQGEVPDMTRPPSGCRFHPRCPFAMDVCRQRPPQAVEVAAGHRVRCHLYGPAEKGPAAT